MLSHLNDCNLIICVEFIIEVTKGNENTYEIVSNVNDIPIRKDVRGGGTEMNHESMCKRHKHGRVEKMERS